MKRKIIKIDSNLCTGCGVCVPSCAEGALQIIDGKAQLVADKYCDGLGACLGECPEGALVIIERDADEFDEEAVEQLLHSQQQPAACQPQHHAHPMGGCPGSQARTMQPQQVAPAAGGPVPSQLAQWPVQLTLVAPHAPFLNGSDLLITADCVPFAYPDFHRQLLAGHSLVIGCPKLDDPGEYVDKLTEIIKRNNLKSVTIAHMEVPCCFGLAHIVGEAVERSGVKVPVRTVVVSVDGNLNRQAL